ncbi:hypothetical protein J2W86_002187 [Delftia lacustris]|nr:hypothetical protein [Delftia lacustris]
MQAVEIHAHSLHGTGGQVLDQDICVFQYFPDDMLPFGGLDICGQALLSPIGPDKKG